MSVSYEKEKKIFRLDTENSTYLIGLTTEAMWATFTTATAWKEKWRIICFASMSIPSLPAW